MPPTTTTNRDVLFGSVSFSVSKVTNSKNGSSFSLSYLIRV